MRSRLESCTLDSSKTLRDAMVSLEKSGVRIVLLTDGEGRLVGTLTDGDIRRAVLKAVTLDSRALPHAKTSGYRVVGPETDRAEVLDLMQALVLDQIPIVDVRGKLIGLHLMHEILGGDDRPNWAVVMAGGRGERLKPLTESLPKPMIRIAGRPILERIVLHLVRYGFRRIFLSIHHLAAVIEDHFGDGSKFGCRIEYLREEEPLGTGGGLSLLPERPTAPVVVMNGDLVTQANLGAMLEHHSRRGQLATVGIREYSHAVPYGCIELEEDRIIRLVEKPRTTFIINAGIYVLDPALLERIPRHQQFPITRLIEDCIAGGERVRAFEITDDWVDVGRHDSLRWASEGKDSDREA